MVHHQHGNDATGQREAVTSFFSSCPIRKEYHDGGIVEQTPLADGQFGAALWDVDKDMIQPMTDHPSQFDYWRAMNHHSFQTVMKNMEENEKQMGRLVIIIFLVGFSVFFQ